MIANIFFGSKEIKRDNLKDIRDPYNNKVVSKYSLCNKNDAIEILDLAKKMLRLLKIFYYIKE